MADIFAAKKITDEVTDMILKYLAVIFFIVLFLIIAYSIIKDMVRERKLIDGKRKAKQTYNEYNYAHMEKVVPLKKRKKSTNNHRRGDK